MYSWLTTAVKQLVNCPQWTYAASPQIATEPTALSALALLAHGKTIAAQNPLDWLVQQQASDGSLGVTEQERTPCWPTSLAVLAWKNADHVAGEHRYATCCQQACNWLLSITGTTPERASHVGHDTTIEGWPWVEGTHSWLEPTVFSLLALEACGQEEHPRSHAARSLIIDRLLPHGGANYGNTVVLGQELLPHIQPSGIALCAIPAEASDPRVGRTIEYLQRVLPSCTATHSLSFGLMGLAAHNIWPDQAESWLARCYARSVRESDNAYELALLCLVGLGLKHPLKILHPINDAQPVLGLPNEA